MVGGRGLRGGRGGRPRRADPDAFTHLYHPASKAAYLGGRFVAALALNSLLLLAVPLGILLAMYFSGIEAELLGPFRTASYLSVCCFILLPNAFFATATQFSGAALSRRIMGSYLGATALWATAYLLGLVLQQGNGLIWWTPWDLLR
ncbi:hypothetical protein [Hymenobacter volaticus]|uniref:ABC-2 type transporter domain-containing protein n=1 Tax=Hymenobacter volaticus TaxID=2932254 RepID=A0ABY4GEQ8_9BACT|nr:hypothetical protein [Hymenobacter volaticus]UOQ69411.1 hypothetical protein MUN86_27390 [Hymenobacter volaticus]